MNIEEQAINLKISQAERKAYAEFDTFLNTLDKATAEKIIGKYADVVAVAKKSGFLQGFDMALKICNGGLENAKN